MTRTSALLLLLILAIVPVKAQNGDLGEKMDQYTDQIAEKIINWRRDFHQFPELSNREFKTAEKVAAHLKDLGMEVQTGIAYTGVVGILKGDLPGPVVALRADMDALPVRERVDIPFASKVEAEYNNQKVGVMHACGHDTHIAILMGAAEVLTAHKKELKGTVKFIFQPAEEGPPEGEEGGAKLMVKEGVLSNPEVEVIFGLHINAQTPIGQILYRPGGAMASADSYRIKVKGKQTHGAYPWGGVDPIVVSAQIVNALQTIVSRQLPLTDNPAVISVGAIHGGVRSNIIPEEVELIGTIRALDTNMQMSMHKKIEQTATLIAQSAGATAEVDISIGYPVTYNNPELTERMVPSLQAVAGSENVKLRNPVMGAEDFSFFAQKVPGFYFFLGGAPKGSSLEDTAPHHTPDFFIDEGGLTLGTKALCRLVIDYTQDSKP